MVLDLRQMAALAAIIEEQSFEKAARKLHITQSAVSQRLRQLEEKLGQTLVVRSNPIQATQAGQQAVKYFRQVSMLQNELMDELSLEQQSGYTKVSIGVNADSLETWFLDAMAPLLNERQLLLDMKVDDQDQTHHLLRTGEVLGCITASPEAMQGCSCIPLGVTPYRCLASPDYIARYFPDGVDAAGFFRAPVAEFNNKDELQNRYLEKFFDVAPGDYPRHRIPSSVTFFEMILRGYACGMVPDQQSREMVEAGKAVDMTPGRYLAIPLYWHVWNLKSDLAKSLTHCLTDAADVHLDSFDDHPDLTHPG